jgi:iron complex transport system substrate-binding protein
LAWQSGNSARVLAKLEALGLTVFVEEPRTLEDVSRSLLNLGKLSGHAQAGLQAMSDFDQRLEALRKSYGVRSQVSVFYEVWHAPLQTLNGAHVVSALIGVCGGRNIFADAIPLAPQVGMEAVMARQPQVIIVGGSNQAPQAHESWQRWSQLPAVANGHIYAVRADWIQRFTPRMLDGAQQLCVALDHARLP